MGDCVWDCSGQVEGGVILRGARAGPNRAEPFGTEQNLTVPNRTETNYIIPPRNLHFGSSETNIWPASDTCALANHNGIPLDPNLNMAISGDQELNQRQKM